MSKVLTVKEIKGYQIFKTPFEYIAKKGKYTAHAKTVKKCIEDVEFKILSNKLKKEPINKDTIIDIKYYRLITGSCEIGVMNFIKSNKLKDKYKSVDLLPILEKNNAYGLEKFKSLITFLNDK